MKRKHTILSTMLLTTITATASIAPVDSVALKNLNTVAASIQSLGTLTKADRTLRLPQLPAGYQLKLKGTDKHPVVDTLGNVYAPLVDSDVMLYFQLTDTNKGLTIDVENIPVKVEGEFSPVSTSQYPEVIPAVREWIPKNGTISLPSKGLILIDPSNFEELQDEMLVFADDLKKQEGFDYKIKKGNSHKNAIYVTLNSTDKSLGEEGYRLYMDEGFRIEAVDAKGAFWGTRTLLQLLNRYG
ncbi:MAG: glycoside hydrolase family 20 zincin-like fold domain-containing protein, partial [Bacteroidales bacterium]